ncbi:MAG: HEAT repeat domain-containing protein [Spirulinaceae cyanobacterium]
MKSSNISSLLKQCSSGEPQQQAPAIIELVKIKAYSAVTILLELLQSTDESIRSNAAYALGRLGEREVESVGPALISLLEDPETLVRSDAAESLGLLAYQPAREAVEFLLQNDTEPFIRADAAETLGDLGDAQAIDSLKLAMEDPDSSVRSYAANSLGLLGTSELIPQLQAYLDSEDYLEVKAELWGAQYRLGREKALEEFLQALRDTDEDLATNMLNVLDDLLSRNLPPTITRDAEHIDDILSLVQNRFLLLSPHAQKLRNKLIDIQRGNARAET